jgi:hypothetical protein
LYTCPGLLLGPRIRPKYKALLSIIVLIATTKMENKETKKLTDEERKAAERISDFRGMHVIKKPPKQDPKK